MLRLHLMKTWLFILALFFGWMNLPAQTSNNKTLFVIDSIPILTDPEDWNQITQDDISDVSTITNKDSLKALGWEKMDAITFIFTKAYRNRPDSIKKIPSLKQLVFKNGAWNFKNTLYTGKYIDYYNSGRIQNEGMLVDGKLNGKLIVYFRNGSIKSVASYKDGLLDGMMNEYYKNGRLALTRKFSQGRDIELWDSYFINGQKEKEKKFKKETLYDTLISYFSTGKISSMTLFKNGEPVRGKYENDLNYYSTMFTQCLQRGDIKTARKTIYKRWRIDSTSIDAHMYEGMLLTREFRFDDAISEFDKVLSMEPLDRNALVERGLARIKKFKYKNAIVEGNIFLNIDDLQPIPEKELQKICSDLLKADEIDRIDYVKRQVSEQFLNFCAKRLISKD